MATADVRTQVRFENILFATDFSRPAMAALPYVLSLVSTYQSKVYAAHVISIPPFTTYSPTEAWHEMAAQALRESERAMITLEPQWKGVHHERLILKGGIWKELQKTVDDKRIDLIVCGTHGRTGVSKVLMGSVAEEIFRHASCPVLTVGPKTAGEPESVVDMHSILFATDFTPESLAAAPYAIALAQEHQARLYLVHVAQNRSGVAAEMEVLDRLRHLVQADAQLQCEPKAFVEFGAPAERVVELADELGLDLIVLGVKRTPAIPGATHLGVATAYEIVSRANCPVLTIRG